MLPYTIRFSFRSILSTDKRNLNIFPSELKACAFVSYDLKHGKDEGSRRSKNQVKHRSISKADVPSKSIRSNGQRWSSNSLSSSTVAKTIAKKAKAPKFLRNAGCEDLEKSNPKLQHGQQLSLKRYCLIQAIRHLILSQNLMH